MLRSNIATVAIQRPDPSLLARNFLKPLILIHF